MISNKQYNCKWFFALSPDQKFRTSFGFRLLSLDETYGFQWWIMITAQHALLRQNVATIMSWWNYRSKNVTATLSHVIYLCRASFCRIIYNYVDILLYRCFVRICTGRYIINSAISIGLVYIVQQVTICSILPTKKIKVLTTDRSFPDIGKIEEKEAMVIFFLRRFYCDIITSTLFPWCFDVDPKW